MSTTPTPPPSGAPDWDAIGRFLAGESAEAEAAQVAAWLAAHPEDAAVIERVNGTANRVASQLGTPIDTEAALARVLARRGTTTVDPSVRPLPQRRTRTQWTWALAAAAGLGVIVASAWWRQTTSTPDVAPQTFASRTVRTTPGQIDSLTLSDGTAVVLGPSSVLTVADGYGAASRVVTLEGDGYFVVSRDDDRPFTVRAAGTNVVDLGTAFSVRTHADGQLDVAVASGRVRVDARRPSGQSLELLAGDAATLRGTADTPERVTVDTAETFSWTRGELILRDAPMSLVRTMVQRWYGLTLEHDDAFAERRVTATFTNEAPTVAVNAIALSLGARAMLRGDTVRLTRDTAR
jgi:transmembrane sensor